MESTFSLRMPTMSSSGGRFQASRLSRRPKSRPGNPPRINRQWPVWARKTAQIAKPEDSGLGDTIARIIGGFGGNAFKLWFKATFKADCGCDARQEHLNWRFPYEAAPPPGRQRKKARLLEEKQ